jgi:hypothetical protein
MVHSQRQKTEKEWACRIASAQFGAISYQKSSFHMETERIPYYFSNCLHMDLRKRPFVKLGISLLLVTHIAGCDISLIGDCTNHLCCTLGLPQGPLVSVQVTCSLPDFLFVLLRSGIIQVDLLKFRLWVMCARYIMHISLIRSSVPLQPFVGPWPLIQDSLDE